MRIPRCLNVKSYHWCPEKTVQRIRYNKHIKGYCGKATWCPSVLKPIFTIFSKIKSKSCVLSNYACSCIHSWCSTYCLYFSCLFLKHFLSLQDNGFAHLPLLETHIRRAITKLASFFSFIHVGSIQMCWSHHQLCDTLSLLGQCQRSRHIIEDRSHHQHNLLMAVEVQFREGISTFCMFK